MTDGPHVLVVDDDNDVCELIETYLTSQHYRVSIAHDGGAMRQVLAEAKVDLVILDLVLPGEDGLTLARSLRAASSVPIIMLTGRADPLDRIVGLEMGADDYLPKPFHLRELLARVKSVLRRAPAAGQVSVGSSRRSRAFFAGWSFDMATRRLVSPAGSEVLLTGGEFDLLVALVTNANQVLSRDRLLDLTGDRGGDSFDRTIDVRVGRLRRKLGDEPEAPELIRTVRGGGYMLTPPVELT